MNKTDWRGNEYGVGSKVIYATTQSSSCTMHEAIVLDVEDTRIRVKPIGSASSYGSSRGERKPVWLTVLNRVTAVGYINARA